MREDVRDLKREEKAKGMEKHNMMEPAQVNSPLHHEFKVRLVRYCGTVLMNYIVI